MTMGEPEERQEPPEPPPPLTLEAVLRKSIQKEIASWLLYNDLSRKLAPEAVREAFAELGQEEKRHQKLLEGYLKGEIGAGALGRIEVLDYKIAEHLEQPPIYPEMKLEETFLLAAHREKSAHDLYLALAAIQPPGEVKSLLEALAAEELGHKQRVETLFTEVAFPQTDGG
jgi:rubrerythrin